MTLKPEYLHEKHLLEHDSSHFETLYKRVEHWRARRYLDGCSKDANSQLQDIAEEIRLRVKITQQEIYFIGEMLVQAREILKENNSSFQEWVESKFDFSYHTAINFCNVYTACMGRLSYIQHVKPSILYKISSKQFPKELRDILLFNDLLKTIKNKELQDIYIEFQNKGFDAVKEKLEEKSHYVIIAERVSGYIDNFKKTNYQIDKVIENLELRYLDSSWSDENKESTKIAKEIVDIVIESLKQCSELLSTAENDAYQKFRDRTEKKYEQSTIAISNDVNSPNSDNNIIDITNDNVLIEDTNKQTET